MHLEVDHPHPHPHPPAGARRAALPWILIAAILGLAAFLALRGGRSGDADVLARFQEGVAILEQYRYPEAYERFAAVARARPDWDAAHFNSGLAALNIREKHLPIAEREFGEALRLNPGNLHARFSLGILLKHQNRLEESFAAFQAVARADPGDPHAQYEYGAALSDQKRYAEAKEALEAAVRLQPAFASALYRLSRVYLALEDKERFQQALDTFRALDQNKEGIKAGEIYGEDGKYYTAIRDPFPPGKERPPAVAPTPSAAPAAAPAPAPRALTGPAAVRTRPGGSPAPPAFAVGDMDGDGALDLVLCGQTGSAGPRAQVWKGEKDGASFRKLAELDADGAAVALGDLDGDGDLDLVLAEEGALRVQENEGKGGFSPSKLKLPPAPAGFPVQALIFDADADWDLDLLLVTLAPEGDRLQTTLALLQNNRDGSFEDVAPKAGIARFPFAVRKALFADLDGDIDADILLLGPMAAKGEEDSTVLVNDRAFRFRKVRARELGGSERLLASAGLPEGLREALLSGRPEESVASLADASGHPYLLRARAGGPLELAPQGAAPAGWLGVDLAGPRQPTLNITWSNVSGVGSTVEARAGERVEVRQSTGIGAGGASGPSRLHFSLGEASRADYLRILWPDGVLQSEPGLPSRRLHRIEEIQRKPSSCPIVFVWDGGRFRYVADLLGVGGLGYLEAPGTYNRPDPTEILELPGLVSSRGPDGSDRLLLRILEPLEECTYLDAVELWAADAPADLTVHPDEIFPVRAPAPGARLLAYRKALLPARATDGRGRDLTAELRSVDRVYAEGWARDRRFPGAAARHALVLEWETAIAGPGGAAPPAGAPRPVLFLYGYVEYGYSTSNFAAAQAGVVLHAPTISVERDGRWVALRDEWGFPAGTPRWMAVDLGGLLEPSDRRIKIETDMEIYWDQAFIAEARPLELNPAAAGEEVRLTLLGPAQADLRFRGFPRDGSPDGRHPRIYDYDDVAPTAPMKPFPGRYTAYGDVRNLVSTADDRLAIFGEGDEVALSFPAERLPPLPAGFRRTYFLSAVGYCKDMDLYTAASDRVEPLPFRGMSAYPPPPGEQGPHGPEAASGAPRRVEPLTLGR